MKTALNYKEINIPVKDFYLKGNLRQAQNTISGICDLKK